jgi:hypothetical protein
VEQRRLLDGLRADVLLEAIRRVVREELRAVGLTRAPDAIAGPVPREPGPHDEGC